MAGMDHGGAAGAMSTMQPVVADGSMPSADSSGSADGSMDGAKEAKISSAFRWKDKDGRDLIYHWMVPPGRHTYRHTLPGKSMTPFDTTVHYINCHVHPYGEYVELRDATANKTLFRANVTNLKDTIGVQNIDVFSSVKGIRVYANHEYEMITEYNNTTQQDIDAMALLYVYMVDKDFDRARLKTFLAQSEKASKNQN